MKLAAADVPTAQQDEIPREAHERVSAAGESAVDLYGPADDAVRESIEALSLSGAPFVQPGIPRRDILVLSLGFGALLTALLGIVQLVDEGMSSAWRSTGLFEATRTHSLGVHSTWWWALGAALCVGFSFVMSHRGDPIPAPSPSGLSNEAWLASPPMSSPLGATCCPDRWRDAWPRRRPSLPRLAPPGRGVRQPPGLRPRPACGSSRAAASSGRDAHSRPRAPGRRRSASGSVWCSSQPRGRATCERWHGIEPLDHDNE